MLLLSEFESQEMKPKVSHVGKLVSFHGDYISKQRLNIPNTLPFKTIWEKLFFCYSIVCSYGHRINFIKVMMTINEKYTQEKASTIF